MPSISSGEYVRGLRMHCAVCSHGGHLKCYRQYYAAFPPVEIEPTRKSKDPAASSDAVSRRGSLRDPAAFDPEKTSRGGIPAQQRAAWGRPCATGCGHICYVSTASPQSVEVR